MTEPSQLTPLERGAALVGGQHKFRLYVWIHDRIGWFTVNDVATETQLPRKVIYQYLKMLTTYDLLEATVLSRPKKWRRVDDSLADTFWALIGDIIDITASDQIPDSTPE